MSTSSSLRESLTPTITPPITITVRPPSTITPIPTRPAPVKLAAQPTTTPDSTRYTVRENDTLLDIALQFGTTVEALQLANPGVDPLSLQIGQELQIPANQNERSNHLEIRQLPPPIPVTSPVCYPATSESLVCLGIISNSLDMAVEGIRVEVQVIGFDGEVLAEQVSNLEQAFISPGDIAPYRVLFDDLYDSDISGLVAAVSAGSETNTLADRFVSLPVENIVTNTEGALYRFSGQVTNPTDRTLASPRLVLTLLDEVGNIHGYRIWQSDTPLAPDETQTVRLSLLPLGLEGMSLGALTYHLHAEAAIPPPPTD